MAKTKSTKPKILTVREFAEYRGRELVWIWFSNDEFHNALKDAQFRRGTPSGAGIEFTPWPPGGAMGIPACFPDCGIGVFGGHDWGCLPCDDAEFGVGEPDRAVGCTWRMTVTGRIRCAGPCTHGSCSKSIYVTAGGLAVICECKPVRPVRVIP